MLAENARALAVTPPKTESGGRPSALAAGALRNVEVAWHEYVHELIAKNTSVSGKEKAGYAALESNPPRPLRAKRFLQEAVDAGSTNARVFLELAQLHFADGHFDDGMALLDKAIALDPLNGSFYSRKGRALKSKDKPEGERLVRLGKEVGDDDPWFEIDLDDEEKPKGGG